MRDPDRRSVYVVPLMIQGIVYVVVGLALAVWGRWAFPPILTITGGIIFVALGVGCVWRAATNRVTRKDVDRIKDPNMWGIGG